METAKPEEVTDEMKRLLQRYNPKALEDIAEFHARFESIHPFEDGNGRVGRLIMFKECLRLGITPFIITDINKRYYYRGLQEWDNDRMYLIGTCLEEQDFTSRVIEKLGYK